MQLENLITQTVELEGLLRVLRDRKAPAVRALAEDKYRALCHDFDEYFAQSPEHPLEQLAKGTIEVPLPPEPAPEIRIAAVAESAPEAEECEPSADADAVHDDVQIIIQRSDDKPAEVVEEPIEEVIDEPIEEITDDDIVGMADDNEPEAAMPPTFCRDASAAPEHDLSHAFTVNDRFLFIRQLFNGDAEDFDQTIKVLSAMPDIAEAKEYLFQDLMWDSSEPAVDSFMNILSRYLPARG